MKSVIKAGVVFFLLISLVTQYSYADTAVKKLGRGLANVVTCPLELIDSIKEVHEEEGIFASMTYGVLKGIVKTVIRAGVGVYEVISFPIPVPNDYAPILTDPEFFSD